MQMNEELIKKIVDAVMAEIGQLEHKTETKPSEGTSLAGKDRINEHKTDYSGYPKAKKGTDPKEIVIGVGAAFQKEIKRTICDIPLDEVLRNVKAGIEEEGMNARVVKILDTSDVCFMALEAAKLSMTLGKADQAREFCSDFISDETNKECKEYDAILDYYNSIK